MPNIPVRAAAEGLPIITRRQVLRGLTALSAGAVALAASTIPAAAAVGGTAKTAHKMSIEERLDRLPPRVAKRLRAQFHAMIDFEIERARSVSEKGAQS
ncbi:hypothetical protein [Mesorhizobium sp. M0522]|uniref:hypothetical protein n=1 Tax=Mesorhizobium sp. M0522 TaxID=2956958 RepID=UPI003334C01C